MLYCRTSSASTAPCTSRRMRCPTYCGELQCKPRNVNSAIWSAGGWTRLGSVPPATRVRSGAKRGVWLVEVHWCFRAIPVYFDELLSGNGSSHILDLVHLTRQADRQRRQAGPSYHSPVQGFLAHIKTPVAGGAGAHDKPSPMNSEPCTLHPATRTLNPET